MIQTTAMNLFFVMFIAQLFLITESQNISTSTYNFNVCPRSNSNFKKCLINELQRNAPILYKNGHKPFGIQSYDPYFIPSMKLINLGTMSNLKISGQNLRMDGLSRFNLIDLNLDLEHFAGNYTFEYDKNLILTGSYVTEGLFLMLNLNSSGPCNFTLVHPVIQVYNITTKEVWRNHVRYLNVKTMAAKIIGIKKLIIKMENFINANSKISKQLNDVVNQMWPLIFEEVKPIFEENVVAVTMDVIQKFLSNVSIESFMKYL